MSVPSFNLLNIMKTVKEVFSVFLCEMKVITTMTCMTVRFTLKNSQKIVFGEHDDVTVKVTFDTLSCGHKHI